MLFFKPKQKAGELLPPPPPFPEEEIEIGEKPKFFDEIIKPEETETFPEEEEFGDLVKEVEELKPAKTLSKKKNIVIKKAKKYSKIKEKSIKKLPTAKKQKITKKEPKKQLKKIAPIEQTKAKKTIPKKLLQSKPIKEIEKSAEEIELPDTLEDFDIENVGTELGVAKEGLGQELVLKAQKPKEILEAEEEIKSAIETLKLKEKPSLFSRLFVRRKKEAEKPESYPISEVANISVIQDNIKKAREALIKFDLETARRAYIEVMRLYNKIKPEEQAKVYHEIRNLYFERKSAEELKV